ncbi:hypothetical protein Tco_0579250 [Tanacetum coccineum]
MVGLKDILDIKTGLNKVVFTVHSVNARSKNSISKALHIHSLLKKKMTQSGVIQLGPIDEQTPLSQQQQNITVSVASPRANNSGPNLPLALADDLLNLSGGVESEGGGISGAIAPNLSDLGLWDTWSIGFDSSTAMMVTPGSDSMLKPKL